MYEKNSTAEVWTLENVIIQLSDQHYFDLDGHDKIFLRRLLQKKRLLLCEFDLTIWSLHRRQMHCIDLGKSSSLTWFRITRLKLCLAQFSVRHFFSWDCSFKYVRNLKWKEEKGRERNDEKTEKLYGEKREKIETKEKQKQIDIRLKFDVFRNIKEAERTMLL